MTHAMCSSREAMHVRWIVAGDHEGKGAPIDAPALSTDGRAHENAAYVGVVQ
jgi:hypothetical protein